MKKTNLFVKLGLGLMVASLVVTTSCQKEMREMLNDGDTHEEDSQTEVIDDNLDVVTESATKGDNAVFRLRFSEDLHDVSKVVGTCALVTRDTLNRNDQDTITIDFGSGCQGQDGRTRTGKIIIIQNGKHFEAGSVRTTQMVNYTVEGKKIEGQRQITNKGKNSSNQTYWEVVATNMKITRTDGKSRTWNSTRIRTIIAGESTISRTDDVYSIEGTSSGVNGKGDEFTSSITSPLIKSNDCNWVKQGTIVFNVANKPERKLDFGDGNCDNQAVVTVKNKTKTITLK